MKLSINTLLEQASKLHEEGEIEQAKTIYETILQEDPEQADAAHQLGMVYVQLANFSGAILWLKKAVLIKPQSLVFRNNLANALSATQQFDEALIHYQKMIAINPQYAQAYNNIGTIYYRQKDYQTAEHNFKLALKETPQYADAHYNLGLCFLKRDEIEKAIEQFIETITYSPNHIAAHHHLANCFFKQQSYEYAVREYQLVLQHDPDNIEINFNLANVFLLQKNYSKAVEFFQHVIDLDSNYVDAYYNLGVIYALHRDDEQAIIYFEKVIDFNKQYSAAYYNLASIYARHEDYKKVEYYYKEILKLEPDNFTARYLLGAISGEQTLTTAPPNYIRSLFDYYADHFEEDLIKNLEYQVPEKLLNLIQPLLSAHASWIIVDLGCGTGLCGVGLKPYAKQLIGVDLAPKMLEVAKEKAIYDELILGDMTDVLNNYQQQIDLICAGDAFIYIGDLDAVIKACAASLKKGGYLLFNTEADDNGTYAIQPSGRFTHHDNYLKQLAADNQFSIMTQKRDTIRKQSSKPVSGDLWLWQKI